MTRPLLILSLCLSAALPVRATDPIYINNSPLLPPELAPQIDATRFVNRSIFDVTTGFTIIIGGGPITFLGAGLVPYETLNTAFFTNTAGASMTGNPGFRFTFFTNNVRRGMEWWVNQGSVSADPLLLINASNIISRDSLAVSDIGLLRVEGDSIDLRRSTLLAGLPPGTAFPGGGIFGTNHQNAVGVSDLYWGAGLNNRVTNDAPPVQIDGPPFSNWTASNAISPVHDIVQLFGGGLFTNSTVVGFGEHTAFVYTNMVSPTEFQVQIAFVPTNILGSDAAVEVRFVPGNINDGADIIVAIESIDDDLFSGGLVTNGVYFVDHSGFTTNIGVTWNGPNFFGNNRTRRPDTYEFFRIRPFQWAFGVTNNAQFSDIQLYTTNMVTNAVNMAYAAYSASWAGRAFTNAITTVGPFGTNLPLVGRVEILGNSVNLDRARLKAETTLIVNARDLTSNVVARVDAPILHFDLRSSEPSLLLTNLAPPAVRRFSGSIDAWSGVWQSTIADTNTGDITIDFHVLILDASVVTIVPVNTMEFGAAADYVDVSDLVTASRSIRIDAPSLTISGSLTLPSDPSYHWAYTNVLNLVNFTNSGTVDITGGAFFGVDPDGFGVSPDGPLDNYVITGSGSISAGSHLINSENVEVAGFVDAFAGVVSIEADTMALSGTIRAISDIQITANTLSASNSIIAAGDLGTQGELIIDVSGSLIDGGDTALNNWTTSGGVRMLTLPGTSDLLGTYITVLTRPFGEAHIAWPAADGGGFGNNLGLGRLTLDGGRDSYYIFESSTGGPAAIYVAFLELLGPAADPVNIEIAENFTVYFGDSNVDPTTIHPRFVRVAAPAPRPSAAPAPVAERSFHPALAQSVTLDSDGDGVVNVFDKTPMFTSDQADLQVVFSRNPANQALISWTAPPNSISTVEYKNSLSDAGWQPRLPVHNRLATAKRFSVSDALSGASPQQRFYRVRIQQR